MCAKAPSYRVAKNLFSEIKNQNQKPINAKICFFSLIGHVGTRAIFQNQQPQTRTQLEGYVGSHITYSRRVHALLYVCTSPAVQCVLLVPQGPSGPIGWPQSRRGFRCSWMYWPFWTVSTMSTLPRRSAAALSCCERGGLSRHTSGRCCKITRSRCASAWATTTSWPW